MKTCAGHPRDHLCRHATPRKCFAHAKQTSGASDGSKHNVSIERFNRAKIDHFNFESLAREGFEIEVVDLRTVKPLDTDIVFASVARTGRLLCVGEAFPWGGVTAEVIARMTSAGFHLLDAAPQRLNAKDTPIPYHPNLWSAHRPNAKNIAAKARALLRE